MSAITFTLHTQQPILATSFQGDPNSDVSYPYIPGSMIRGALIGRYLKQNPAIGDDILADTQVRHLFFSGQVRYLNAYLVTKEEYQPRSLPTPRSWFQNKGEEPLEKIYDLSRMELSDLDSGISPKPVKQQFCSVNHTDVILYKEERRINIHNQRHRSKGRSTEAAGEVFRYEALDANQQFQSVILCEEKDKQVLEELLKENDNIWLGGSQSAGYGHTKISEFQFHETWDEVGKNQSLENRIESEYFQITLLSDMILQNEWGQYVVKPPIQLLAESLDIEPEQLKLQKGYMSSTLIGGFNKKWGLPLPQVPAIASGSVFVFKSLLLDLQRVKDLEFYGLGERTIEGFGRVAVNWLNLDNSTEFSATLPKFEPSSTDPPKLPTGSKSAQLAKEMAKRLFCQKLDEKLRQKVSEFNIEGNISNSQLSRLMIVARKALNDPELGNKPNLQQVSDLLGNLPSNASDQFEYAKIGNQSLERQIKEWMSGWIDISPVTIAGESYDLSQDENLAPKYTLLLIMAIAKKATKE
ncbi:RAMP superfamily CRISPR-associated protein [Kamptonema sp. UHCC 0994]|uniref:RAMP superfamily CRISPR-associated protein n=1 Tax=Kamptonema sp. UHCC 0994 TaxID=3031329 RepID=UPI0023BAF555|nr:RAMP superfamily CRISPR-associated protein [Kamptonema sp. UHCC 0994]MDF0556438.1 RAMP superfamily CRISPR-associated protein [Kamptonema sp. UHCC 0994]